MKILTARETRAADEYTMKNEPISSLELMERAASVCSKWLLQKYAGNSYQVFCGVGNNGGDGLAVARQLYEAGCQITCYKVAYSSQESSDFKANLKRLEELNVCVQEIGSKVDVPAIENSIVIDAIFGTGLNRAVNGISADVIQAINGSDSEVISIDIPSGLFSENNANSVSENIVLADHTLTFELPKLSFLFPENGLKVGEVHILSIGLNVDFIKQCKSQYYLITLELASLIVRKRYSYAHKGTFGHALLACGSKGKIGAAHLASKASLRSGAGLVTVNIPKCGTDILQQSIPEVMVLENEGENYLQGEVKLKPYDAIGIGPGIGTEEQTQNFLKLVIQNRTTPIVFDADAINILSENKTWLAFLPPGCVFTPHPKEFERLVGKSSDNYSRMEMQLVFAKKYNCYLVLKGANTAITCPDGDVFFNTTGNPGMATAGSGDALTGIITGLLAQGYSPKQSCLLGVYIHGKAGDLALDTQSQESLVSSDVIENLGKAFQMIHE